MGKTRYFSTEVWSASDSKTGPRWINAACTMAYFKAWLTDCKPAAPLETLQPAAVRGAYGIIAAAVDGKWQLLRPGRDPPEQDESLPPCSVSATSEAP